MRLSNKEKRNPAVKKAVSHIAASILNESGIEDITRAINEGELGGIDFINRVEDYLSLLNVERSLINGIQNPTQKLNESSQSLESIIEVILRQSGEFNEILRSVRLYGDLSSTNWVILAIDGLDDNYNFESAVIRKLKFKIQKRAKLI